MALKLDLYTLNGRHVLQHNVDIDSLSKSVCVDVSERLKAKNVLAARVRSKLVMEGHGDNGPLSGNSKFLRYCPKHVRDEVQLQRSKTFKRKADELINLDHGGGMFRYLVPRVEEVD